MLYTNAEFSRKQDQFALEMCAVKKVIKLSGAEYDYFTRNMLRDQDFIRDNIDLMQFEDGARGCLLVVGEGRRDGILVDSSGYDYARYAAFIPNAESFLLAEQYPALTALNHRLTDIVDFIVAESATSQTDNRTIIDLQELETLFGIDVSRNNVLYGTILNMLESRPEIQDFELDKDELIIYRAPELEPTAEDLSDLSITKTDMYAYGYSFEGMIPLGRDRALELYDKGREVFLLYEDDTEGAAESRADIESFDGIFGAEDPAWNEQAQSASIEVFIVNRERQAKGENIGEWLALPAGADTLRGLFEHIGMDRPSEGAFTITAVRVPQEYLRNHVTKYDSLDELNMLASYMSDMEDFELDKFQAILTSRVMDVGKGTAALINLLDADNFDAFNLIDADDAESLGRYYDAENDEKPDGVTFEQYGYQCIKEEEGVFTEHGYICCRYGELPQEYTGVVPDEYKIVGAALQGLRSKQTGRSDDEKPSVVEKIRAARSAPRVPKDKDAQKHKKSKEGQEL